MKSINRFIPDAAFRLRAADDAAITADISLSAGELVTPIAAVWNEEAKDGKVVFFVRATELAAGDSEYSLEVVSSATEDLASPAIHVAKEIDVAGWSEILIDQHSVLRDNPTHQYYGLRVNVGGTAPSVKIEAYVLPPVGL
jgi:hypothetical protein